MNLARSLRIRDYLPASNRGRKDGRAKRGGIFEVVQGVPCVVESGEVGGRID